MFKWKSITPNHKWEIMLNIHTCPELAEGCSIFNVQWGTLKWLELQNLILIILFFNIQHSTLNNQHSSGKALWYAFILEHWMLSVECSIRRMFPIEHCLLNIVYWALFLTYDWSNAFYTWTLKIEHCRVQLINAI